MAISDAVRQIGITEPTYYRWRKQYGGMNRDQLKRLKELETENQRLRRAVSDLTLDSEAQAAIGPRTMASERRACRTLGQHRSTRAAGFPAAHRTRNG
ncbi:Transposase [Jannaschia seosinensis]|nr:Transposase [Jannaschia seosinensis]